eukprot:2678725-Pleurochrysis_carterae.AAC.1
MLAPVLGKVRPDAMPHQDVVTNVNASRCARPMRMHALLPMTISSVDRLLLHTDRLFSDRIPNSTQTQSKRIDKFTLSERCPPNSAKKGVHPVLLCTVVLSAK